MSNLASFQAVEQLQAELLQVTHLTGTVHHQQPWHKSVLCVTLLIILLCLDAVFLASFILTWKRRHLQPLMFRAPVLGIFISLGATMGFTWTFMKLLTIQNSTFVPKSFLCTSWSWVAWISYPFVVIPMVLRAYRLWRVFRATEDRYHELSAQGPEESTEYLINGAAVAGATSGTPAGMTSSSSMSNIGGTPVTASNAAYGGMFSFSTPVQAANSASNSNMFYTSPLDSPSTTAASGGYARIPGRQTDSPRSKLLPPSDPLATPSSTTASPATSTPAFASATPLLMSAHGKKAQFVESQVMTEATMLKIFAVAMVIIVVIKIIVQTLGMDSELGFGCNGSVVAIVPLCFNIIQATLGAYLLFIFRNIKDDYGAAREVSLISGMWVAATVIEILALMVSTSSLPNDWADIHPTTYGIVHGVCHLCRALWIIIICGIRPLHQTFTTQFVSLWSDYSSLSSLDALLYDMVCLNYFHAFLLNEQMSADYLSCWMEIELYNELALSLVKVELEEEGLTLADIDRKPRYFAQLRLHASRIFDRYIAPGCDKELKLITEVTRQKLVADINAGFTNHHTFDRVQGEAYAVMNSSFPRFKSSIYHRKCLADLDRDEQLRSVLEKSGMIDAASQVDV